MTHNRTQDLAALEELVMDISGNDEFERIDAMDQMQALADAYPDDEEFAIQYSMGLAEVCLNSPLELALIAADRLRILAEKPGAHLDVLVSYAQGLSELGYSGHVFLITRGEEFLRPFVTSPDVDSELAYAYSSLLHTLSCVQEPDEAEETLEHLRDLTGRSILEGTGWYIRGLTNLFICQAGAVSEHAQARLTALMEAPDTAERMQKEFSWQLERYQRTHSPDVVFRTFSALLPFLMKYNIQK